MLRRIPMRVPASTAHAQRRTFPDAMKLQKTQCCHSAPFRAGFGNKLVGFGIFVEKLAVGVAFGDATFLGSEFEGILAIEFGLVHEFVDARGEGLRGVRLGARRILLGGANHQSNFALGGLRFEGLKEFGEPSASELLVNLSDLASEASVAVAEDGGGVGNGFGDAMGRFVKDQGAIFDAKTLKGALAFPAAGGKEAQEKKFFVRQAGSGKSREKGGRPGNGNHRNFMANG